VRANQLFDNINMLKNLLNFLFFTTILCVSCSAPQSNNKNKQESQILSQIALKHAKGFTVDYMSDSVTRLTVFNPWQGAQQIKYEYYLIERNKTLPQWLNGKKVLRTPIQRIVCLSTTHIALLDFIGETGKIVGVSGAKYVCNTSVILRIEQNKIVDVGYDQQLNLELLLSLKPDLVMAYGVGGEAAAYTAKIEALNIPVVYNAEYLEETPLAKAEWVKFAALLFNKFEMASTKFDSIETAYNQAKMLVANQTKKPFVLCNLPWKDVWYLPGGRSYSARLIEDAGGGYILSADTSREAIPTNIEWVFDKAQAATFWINPGAAASKQEITSTDQRLARFLAFKTNSMYNNNAIISKNGGNDYWESGITNPHVILRDLISIFHPELLPNYQPVYYKHIDK